MYRWKDVPAFLVRRSWPKGESPRENHPAQWGPLELHRFGQIALDGTPFVTVAVHSTRRSRDGWSYNVAEQRNKPAWVGYFHHGPTGQRLMHRGTDNSADLERVFGLHHLL